MPRLNPNLRPPGGFRFVDESQFTHVAPNFDALVKLVTGYRKRTNRPPGNPAEEIAAQICQRSPHCCFFP